MDRITRDNSVLVVIDVQEKFRPVIRKFDETVDNITKLIQGFQAMDIPIIVTEQYPKGLGTTVDEIKKILEFKPIEKVCFSCLKEGKFKEELEKVGKKHIVLCGIEAHVCLFQTGLDLMDAGYTVHFIVDAVSSRKRSDEKNAVIRMEHEGVKAASTEMILFQLLEKAGTDEFKKISKIVK